MKEKKASETLSISTHIVLPNDTNFHNNLFGGTLMSWIDIAASVASKRHSNSLVVTASVNNISFDLPIRLGDIVTLEAKVTRAFTTSMEIFVEVWVEDTKTAKKIKCNEAITTFVAIDEDGKPVSVPRLVPETKEEKIRFDGALRRKQLSLILAKRMKPGDAEELKALFIEN